MELTIGIRDTAAPLIIDTETGEDVFKSELTQALSNNSFLEITATDGTVTIIPAAAFGYVQIAKAEQRHVGFGFIEN